MYKNIKIYFCIPLLLRTKKWILLTMTNSETLRVMFNLDELPKPDNPEHGFGLDNFSLITNAVILGLRFFNIAIYIVKTKT